MDNRFGVKDFFLFGIMALLVLLVLLSMKQFDRQYQLVVGLESKSRELTEDIARLNRRVGELQVAPAGTKATAAAPAAAADAANDPFGLMKQAKALPNYADGDWLVYNLGSKLSKITPLISSDAIASTVQARVLEPLIVREPDTLKWQPLLAASWEVHPDGLGVTYKLRPDLRFSDGSPLTSADVKFTFDRILDPELAAARARSYLVDNGVQVEAPTPDTVVFRLKKPYFEMMSITGTQGVLPKAFYEKYPPGVMNDNPGLLLGSGAYRVMEGGDSWRPGKVVTLVRNERYWGTPPAFNRIVYKEVQEETVYSTLLRNGELDFSGATPDQFKSLRKDEAFMKTANDFVYQSMLGGYTYIAWNQERGGKKTAFADKRVRQAMTMLIDREKIARDLYEGFANVATGPFTTKGLQADPSVKPLPFDIEAAKAKLKEAGYEDRDGDGIVESATGEKLRYQLTYGAGNAFSERIATLIKDQLARGGVIMELKSTDWPVMIEQLTKSQFDAVTLGWTSSVEGDLYQIFHSSQRGDAGDNRTSYSNPELDKLIEQARAEVDENKRTELWRAAHRIVAEDQPYTFLVERKALAFYSKRIQNVKPTRMGTNFMTTEPRVPPWFVPSAEQKYTQN